MDLISKQKQQIDNDINPDEAGQRAVLHEVISKAHHSLLTEMNKFVPTGKAADQQRSFKIQQLIQHEKRNIERFHELSQQLHKSHQISKMLKKVKLPEAAPIAKLEQSLGKLKRGNKSLRLTHDQQKGQEKASALVDDIDQILKHAEDKRQNNIAKAAEFQRKDKKLQKSLAATESELATVHTKAMEEQAAAMKHRGSKVNVGAIPVAETIHTSSMGAGVDEDPDAVDSLVGDINGFLKSAAAAESNHNPYLLENALAKTLIDPTILLEQAENVGQAQSLEQHDSMGSGIPFLTDDESSNTFNNNGYDANQRHTRSRAVARYRERNTAAHDSPPSSADRSNSNDVDPNVHAPAKTDPSLNDHYASDHRNDNEAVGNDFAYALREIWRNPGVK